VDQGLHTIDMDESIAQIDEFESYEEFPRLSVAAPPRMSKLAEQPLFSIAVNECHIMSRVNGMVLLPS
jgi:hypothetical protein